MKSPFDPVRVGAWDLPQRFVMAPLTRNRAGHGMAPTALNAEYYGQRAGAGLIVAEGTQPSAVGQGYMNSPGLHTADQVEGWRQVARAVHQRGGRIVTQIMHCGRIAHPENKLGVETVAPSAVQAAGQIITPSGMKPHAVPRAIDTDEISAVIGEFVQAGHNAVAAELDGVELHSANGYLLHQFLAPSSNHRTDAYGGSPENRARFVIEAVRATAEAIGPERVGLRISPQHGANWLPETDDADARATYTALVEGIADVGIAYLSVLADPTRPLIQDLRRRFGGTFMVNNGFGARSDLSTVTDILRRDLADLVVVGRPFIANPDLAIRWRTGADLNQPDSSTFYGGGATGYTDYPALRAC